MSDAAANPVVLDARMVRHSGIGTHIRGLLEGWREAAPDFRPILIGDPAMLRETLPDVERYTIVPFRAAVYSIREQLAWPVKALRGALLHVPHYNIPLRYRGPLVVTIHDLIHLDRRYGPRSPLKRAYAAMMLRAAAARAGRICAVSQATASDLVARLRVPADRINVVYNAPAKIFLHFQPDPAQIEMFRGAWALPDDYFLAVGIDKPHKNLDLILDAVASLRREGRLRAPLVVAGLQDAERRPFQARVARRDLGGAIRVLERIPADALPLLYYGARALVHASLLEGFGLPIVEAQAVGTPVLAARASAVPEIAGEGALYFDPRRAEDLARQMIALIESPDLRESLVAAGRRNVARFSWRVSAAQVLAVYASVR